MQVSRFNSFRYVLVLAYSMRVTRPVQRAVSHMSVLSSLHPRQFAGTMEVCRKPAVI